MLGIRDDIEEYLMELERIAHDARQLRIALTRQFDVGRSKRGGPNGNDFLQDRVDAHRTPGGPARSGERKQVPDDLRGAVGFAVDGLDVAAQGLGNAWVTRRSSRCPSTP